MLLIQRFVPTFFGAEYNDRRSTMDRSRVVLRNYPAAT